MYLCMNCIFPFHVYNEEQIVNMLFIFKAAPCYFIFASVYLAGFLSLSLFSLVSAPTHDTLQGRMVLGSGCVWV